ncbi:MULTISPECIES: hypothetical protein [Photobacterium]|uniref:hypothetical protein n=1 Tax=Photobacterium TaxID=657 RepID=UPI002E1921E1|nr:MULTISPECIES: hypothetical protein [Photobacterium]MEC6799108.1 hypothetical protein [Photobacterium sp. S4TG1]MEC6909714.1 hypothetical protein [Photobacterium piscicola]
MIVNFNLVKNQRTWSANIHQLNSDVLKRHVLINGNVDNLDISFSYCEKTSAGNITNSSNKVIGNFYISY